MTWILTISEVGGSWAGRAAIATRHATEQEAQAALAAYVTENWPLVFDDADDRPDDPDEAVREYFNSVDESYTIAQVYP